MGQYFKAVILAPTEEKTEIVAFYRAWNHDNNGAKISEHSWIEITNQTDYFPIKVSNLPCSI